MIKGFGLATDVFTDDDLEDIVHLGESKEFEKAAISSNVSDSVILDDIRQTDISWIKMDDAHWFFKKLEETISDVNQEHFNFDLQWLEPLQYTVYNPGGFYKQHWDYADEHAEQLIDGKRMVRKLSFSILLSDPSEYEGGDLVLCYPQEQHTLPKDKGSILFFPSFITHEVTKVISGVRKSLVGWVRGPVWR